MTSTLGSEVLFVLSLAALAFLILALSRFFEWFGRREHRREGSLVFVTWALVVVGVCSFGAALLQWDAISGQLHLMQADQRPWIKVDVETFDDLHLADWPGIPVKFFVENIGRTPAFNVDLTPAAFVEAGDHTDLFGNMTRHASTNIKTWGRFNLPPAGPFSLRIPAQFACDNLG